ncbi:MAG: M18 family aminopeptidase, partial [Clostridia bacterium]|nr:M18 family aminopeptidase [Clostridia bacterium]
MKSISAQLADFIKRSPSPFHAVSQITERLEKQGFTRLKEDEIWQFKSGKYFVTRNGSSIIAFDIPEKINSYHFQLVASHSDSPTYKVKSVPELCGPDDYLRLNVEGYGGMIDSTWLDRPLSVAGRVFVREGSEIVSRLLYIDKDILLIPNVAIHFNREINSGYKFNRQVDLCPLFSAGKLKKGDFDRAVAEFLDTEPENIIAKDLFLVNRQEPKIWGLKNEFISAPKLDDLQAAFVSLEGFLQAQNKGNINVYCCFDNEEVGSLSKQGAMSTLLKDTLCRINTALGKTSEDRRAAIAKSIMVSFD